MLSIFMGSQEAGVLDQIFSSSPDHQIRVQGSEIAKLQHVFQLILGHKHICKPLKITDLPGSGGAHL